MRRYFAGLGMRRHGDMVIAGRDPLLVNPYIIPGERGDCAEAF